MKTFILILKGILVFSTIGYWIVLICAVDTFPASILIIGIIIGTAMIFACKFLISEEDMDRITFTENDPNKDII